MTARTVSLLGQLMRYRQQEYPAVEGNGCTAALQ